MGNRQGSGDLSPQQRKAIQKFLEEELKKAADEARARGTTEEDIRKFASRKSDELLDEILRRLGLE